MGILPPDDSKCVECSALTNTLEIQNSRWLCAGCRTNDDDDNEQFLIRLYNLAFFHGEKAGQALITGEKYRSREETMEEWKIAARKMI